MAHTFFLLLLLCSFTLAHPVALDDPGAESWHMAGEEAVWIGPEKSTLSIPLLKSGFANGPGTLQIDTDGRTLTIDSGQTHLEVNLNGDHTRLLLNGSPNNPVIAVDGRSFENVRGKWISIALSPGETFTLSLPKSTYATIKFDATSPANRQLAMRNSLRSNPVALRPPAGGSAINSVESAKPAVFQVKIKDERHNVLASGTGFLVSADGLAMTNFHVIQGASSAVAILQGSPAEVPIELVDVHPELDLALVRVTRLPADILPLDFEPDVTPGEDVFALGYPMDLGFTVNKGSINGVREFDALPERLRRAMKGYANTSEWIQTDCTINHGNSGGPLLNARAKVVGINTWCYTEANNTFFALSARHAIALLKQPHPATLSFADLKSRYKSAETPWGLFPTTMPSSTLKKTTTADDIAFMTNALSTSIERTCLNCGGRGIISSSIMVGTTHDNFPRPIYQTREASCPACDGTGFVHGAPDVVDRNLLKLTSLLAAANTANPRIQEKLPKAYSVLAENLCAAKWIKQAIVTRSRGVLATLMQSPKPNAPAYLIGYVLKTGPMPQSEEHVHIVLELEGHRLAMIIHPALSDNIFPGDPVLAGGTYAGTYESQDGQTILMLQGGFIIKDATLPAIAPKE